MDPLILSSAIDAGSGFAGQAFGNYSGRKSSKRAAKYQRWNAAWAANELPSMQVAGLRKAGLNPILAVGGMRAGQMPSVPAPQIAANNRMDSIAQSAERLSSAALKNKTKELTNEQVNLTKTQQVETANRALKEAALASSAIAQKTIDEMTANVYQTRVGRAILPILRASKEAGLRPDLMFGALSNSASFLAKFLFTKKGRLKNL